MNEQTLRTAIAEAERFLEKARAVKATRSVTRPSLTWVSGGRESAACKRASMDLTRALADLRRPS